MPGEKILVVDDVGFNRLLLERHLTTAGYVVEQASGGREALKRLARERFDLVITDLMMPDMDGLQLLDERKSQTYSDQAGEIPCPPFLLCTAHIGIDATEEAAKKGFSDVMMKPVDSKRLLESVTQALLGAQESLTVQLIGNHAAIAKRLAERTRANPDSAIGAVLEVLSLCDMDDAVTGIETLKSYLADKLHVDLADLNPREEEE